MINIRKRGNVYQYSFEIAKVDGKRRQITKSEFATKKEAQKAGVIAYNEYMNTGNNSNQVTCHMQIIWNIGLAHMQI